MSEEHGSDHSQQCIEGIPRLAGWTVLPGNEQGCSLRWKEEKTHLLSTDAEGHRRGCLGHTAPEQAGSQGVKPAVALRGQKGCPDPSACPFCCSDISLLYCLSLLDAHPSSVFCLPLCFSALPN